MRHVFYLFAEDMGCDKLIDSHAVTELFPALLAGRLCSRLLFEVSI